MRQVNARLVARFALEADEFTATEAMAATDLTRATVLGVCADLVSDGWLEEATPAPNAGMKGRPALRYHLSRAAGVVVALDADEHQFLARVADLRGTALGGARVAVEGRESGPDARAAAARRTIHDALADAGRAAHDVLLTVVGIPAPADASGRSPAGDRDFWSVMNAHLAEALDGATIVENDANLAALAERAQVSDAGTTIATLLTGERLGSGLVVDGRLIRGPHGGAGEMRFLRLMFPEEQATDGFGALARDWARRELAGGDEPSTLRVLPPAELTAEDVFSAAAAGDPLAGRIAAQLGDRLARIAFTLGSLLDVERVVVCGTLAPAMEPVLETARAALGSAFEPPVPELAASRLGGDVVVAGAIRRALATVHDDPLQFLPRPR